MEKTNKGQRIPRIEDYFFGEEDEYPELYVDSQPTFREWLREDWRHYLLVPFLPFLWLLGWSMEIGQRITGDKSTGAFPTGCFGACFGVILLSVVCIGIVILLVGI